jgi:hypothetical protein
MSRLNYVRSVVHEAGHSLGEPELQLGERSCSVALEVQGLKLTMTYGSEPEELLWLFVDLGPVPDDAELLRGLLAFGLLSWAAAQMTLGIDGERRRLVGYVALPVVVLTTEGLIDALNQLHARGAELVDRLAHRDLADALPQENPP